MHETLLIAVATEHSAQHLFNRPLVIELVHDDCNAPHFLLIAGEEYKNYAASWEYRSPMPRTPIFTGFNYWFWVTRAPVLYLTRPPLFATAKALIKETALEWERGNRESSARSHCEFIIILIVQFCNHTVSDCSRRCKRPVCIGSTVGRLPSEPPKGLLAFNCSKAFVDEESSRFHL